MDLFNHRWNFSGSKLKTSNLEDYLDLNYTGNNNPFKKGIDNFYSKSEARYSNNYHAILNAKTKELWIVISFKDWHKLAIFVILNHL